MNRTLVKRMALAAVIVAGVVLFFALDLRRYLTLEYVQGRQEWFAALYEAHRPAVVAVYFGAYIAVVTLNLPGAAVMTLLGGFLFGFWIALVVVSFASTLGATAACFVSRYVVGHWVQRMFAGRLERINRGIEREGAFYLFTLRLIPVVPFFAINLVMGLTRMPLWKFYWVSQLGMLPGTAVYVNAGAQLSRIDSLSGLLSPELIASFVLLGVFPLAVKKAVNWYRLKKGKRAVS